MAIYNLNGGQLGAAYGTNGGNLSQAYDLQGNPLMTGGGVDLTIMAYNVGQWYDGSHSTMPVSYYPQYSVMQSNIMENNAPDIATFTEYLDPVTTGHSVDEMIGEYFDDSEDRGNDHIAMRKAIFTKGLTIGETTLVSHSAVQSSVPWCYLRTSVVANGHTINIFIVHYYNGQSATAIQYRKQHADEIRNIVSGLQYYIVLGDFNVICTSVNDADYINVIKPYLDMGCHVANCTQATGFNYTWFPNSDFDSGARYTHDNIVTSPNIVMRNAYRDMTKDVVCTQLGTRIDHVPLIAEITVY